MQNKHLSFVNFVIFEWVYGERGDNFLLSDWNKIEEHRKFSKIAGSEVLIFRSEDSELPEENEFAASEVKNLIFLSSSGLPSFLFVLFLLISVD